jgi:putative ABC transport system permease protein
MASLSYATAGRIATRELHSSRGKFTFVILSVAIGVAALTGVRGFSASFRSMLTLRARSIMAGDLSARTAQLPTPNEQAGLNQIYAEGTDATQVIELNSMASSPTSLDPLLVSRHPCRSRRRSRQER